MRIAISSAPNGRTAVRERQKRDRALAPVMRTKYPTLATLQLDFDFVDTGTFLPSRQVTVFHPPARAYFRFACPYSDCDGEFDLTSAVVLMIGARESRSHGQRGCAGMRHGAIRCTLNLEYSVVAEWRPMQTT